MKNVYGTTEMFLATEKKKSSGFTPMFYIKNYNYRNFQYIYFYLGC